MIVSNHLNIVGETCEDKAGDDENHNEETKFWNTLCQSEDDGLKTPRMSKVDGRFSI